MPGAGYPKVCWRCRTHVRLGDGVHRKVGGDTIKALGVESEAAPNRWLLAHKHCDVVPGEIVAVLRSNNTRTRT